MQITDLLTTEEERAVSPVIGVILMVAITVILAAVIGTFVLGLGDEVQQTAPTSQFAADYSENAAGNDTLDFTHEGGETVQASNLNVSGSNVINGSTTGISFDGAWLSFGPDGDVSAGTTATVNASTVGATSSGWSANSDSAIDFTEATIRIVWTAEGGGNSATLKEWTGPDA